MDDRIAAMDGFMKAHFPEMRRSCTNLLADKAGRASVNGYVELASLMQARMITEQVRAFCLQLHGHKSAEIKSALTDIDRNRNWALVKAKELIEASPFRHAKIVLVKREAPGGTVRGVYGDDIVTLSQAQRFTKGGTFHRAFADLQLLLCANGRTDPSSMRRMPFRQRQVTQ